ncbi:hypothetical protein [Clostridium sp. YIM B02569]|uniref:hypothetical protein n=1 Tax=Clostridium sp. YIM B02569 TaxID=2911967 RepID=UPI001EEBD723|nr:hypothetical protein [Clostridium sp. YIM B02569]
MNLLGDFAKKKNQCGYHGYQLASAFTGKHSEKVAMLLDSGNSHCTDHYNDLLKSIILKYKDQPSKRNLILRIDSGFGSVDSVKNCSQFLS